MGHCALALQVVEVVDDEKHQRDVLDDEREERQVELRRTTAVDHAIAAGAEEVEIERGIGCDVDLDDAVDAPPFGGEANLLNNVGLPIVDHGIGTRCARQRRLLRAAHCRHNLARPEQARELNRVVADRPCATGHQHPAACHAAIGDHRMQGGQRRDAQARAGLVADAGRQGHGLPLRQDDVLRRRPEGPAPGRIPDPDALADALAGHAAAHSIDHAHAVAVRHDARKRHGAAAQARA